MGTIVYNQKLKEGSKNYNSVLIDFDF